MGVLRESLRLF